MRLATKKNRQKEEKWPNMIKTSMTEESHRTYTIIQYTAGLHKGNTFFYSITILGTGAKWLQAIEDKKVHPSKPTMRNSL
jgi:hypothetical protein